MQFTKDVVLELNTEDHGDLCTVGEGSLAVTWNVDLEIVVTLDRDGGAEVVQADFDSAWMDVGTEQFGPLLRGDHCDAFNELAVKVTAWVDRMESVLIEIAREQAAEEDQAAREYADEERFERMRGC